MRSYSPFDIARTTSKYLLDINGIIYNSETTFEFASGRLSPVYVDTRLIWSYPAIRNHIVDMAIYKICDVIGSRNFDVIAGGATAGIPLGVLVANRMDKPFIYVRGSRKGYGGNKQIEGYCDPGAKALLVDDLISGGSSKFSFLQVLGDAQAQVEHVFVIFNYGFDEIDSGLWYAQGVNLHCMTDFKTTLDVAQELDKLPLVDIINIQKFLENPDGWMENYSVGKILRNFY